MARYLVEAHVLEGRPVSELAAAHGVHRSWIYKLLARYRDGGYEALAAALETAAVLQARDSAGGRSRRSCELRQPAACRRPRCRRGDDRLPPRQSTEDVPSLSTIWRILKREGSIVPQPQKRPRSSLIRFQAELPNEMWQADITALAAGRRRARRDPQPDRRPLPPVPRPPWPTRRPKPRTSWTVFHKAAELHGLPASLLCDNGAVFTATSRQRQGAAAVRARAARGRLQELKALPPADLRQGRAPAPDAEALPGCPGARSETLTELQGQLDRFVHYYNDVRPHRALDGRTPLQAYSARVKAKPAARRHSPRTHFRVREDKVDAYGKVSLRYESKLYNIGLGRAHKGRHGQAPDRRPEHPRDRPRRTAHPRAHA